MLYNRNIICKPSEKKLVPEAEGGEPQYDDFYNRLLKLIPVEIIALYMTFDSIAANNSNDLWLPWTLFGITLICAWIYLKYANNVTKIGQQIITIVALCIWIFAIGGPFSQYSWYHQYYGELLVVLYTFIIPLVYKPEE